MNNNEIDSLEEMNPGSSHLSMVEWYAPDQLLKTFKEVVVSSLFSHHADRRAFYTEWQDPHLKAFSVTIQKSISPNYEHNEKRLNIDLKEQSVGVNTLTDEIWLDYVADTGDGGNSTYTVASLLQNDINVNYNESKNFSIDKQVFNQILADHSGKLPRADVLILGGDLVYPIASEENYKKYFINHFTAALPKLIQNSLPLTDRDKTRGIVFAFPQNHDWYDSLASFSSIFCHKEKDIFLDLYCPQEQSYSAIKLPYDWWLFGLDFGLTDDIDDLQFDYFRKIIQGNQNNRGLNQDSKVIIQYPTPYWTLSASGEPKAVTYRYEDLEKLIETATGKEIELRLAGDQHHYRRYTSSNGKNHLITCGMGGAFLHPTHGPESMNTIYHQRDLSGQSPDRKFTYECDDATHDCRKFTTSNEQQYPSPKKSFQLSLGNLNDFFLRNILFGLFGLFNTDIKLLYNQFKEKKTLSDKFNHLIEQYKFRFGLITALTYFVVVWLNFVCLHTDLKLANIHSIIFKKKGLSIPVVDLDFLNYFQAFELWCWAFLMSPLNMTIILIMILNFGTFARSFNTHAPNLSFWLGIVHGILHFLMIFTCYWLILYCIDWPNHLNPVKDEINLSRFFAVGFWIFIMGDIFGTLLMAFYLFITVNLHRWIKSVPLLHFNEAFSSLSIQDYKGILRMRITPDKLEAFVIGVDKVPKQWKPAKRDDLTQPAWESKEDTDAIKPELIDYWSIKT